MTSHSSPNRIVWQYFDALRRARIRVHEAEENHRCQEIAVAVFLSVTVVEVFLNVFFRVVVEENPYEQHKESLLRDLSPPFLSLDKKWKRWPSQILGSAVDSEVNSRFQRMKDLRNRLMHFSSSHDTIEPLDHVRIEGLPNTSCYDDLSPANADEAVTIAEDAIGAIFRAKGVPAELVPRNLQMWTGKVPV